VLDNFIIGGFVLGNLISAYLILGVGRRWVVLTALPVAFVTAFILSFTMHESNFGKEDEYSDVKEDYRHLERAIFLLFLNIYMLAISVGLSNTVWSITSEILPGYLLA
jgi:MFS family permease